MAKAASRINSMKSKGKVLGFVAQEGDDAQSTTANDTLEEDMRIALQA